MPLAGIKCCKDGSNQSFEHCIGCAHDRECSASEAILRYMQRKATERSGFIGLSASELSSCPKQLILKKSSPFYESADENYARWRGDMMHEGQEKDLPRGTRIEERMGLYFDHPEHGKFFLHGKPDLLQANGILIDHKTTMSIPKSVKPEHEAQLNVYAYLLSRDGREVKEAWVHYMGMKNEVHMQAALWSEEAIEQYIITKSGPHLLASSGKDPGPLDAADSWRTKWCPFAGTGQCCGDN